MISKILNEKEYINLVYTEKIRIYPNESQRKLIGEYLSECTRLYDYLVKFGREQKESTGCFPSEFELSKPCTKFGSFLPRRVKMGVMSRVATGYTLFINYLKECKELKSKGLKPSRKVKPPKLKNNRTTKSFTMFDVSKKIIKNHNKLFVNKHFGYIKAVFTRPITGQVKTCTIKRLPSGKYYAFLSIRGESPKKMISCEKKSLVGIDPGIEKYVTMSDGSYVNRTKFFDGDIRYRLRRAQRKLSRMKKGSQHYKRQKLYIAKLHEKIADKRYDFQMKLAHYLVNHYDTIFLENLQSSFMMKKKKRKKKSGKMLTSMSFMASDAAHYQFKMILGWMANKYDSELIFVNPSYTSQMCSQCNLVVWKSLGDRIHSCPRCGLVIDRDLNAANNILIRGLMLGDDSLYGTVGTTGSRRIITNIERFALSAIAKVMIDSKKPVEITVPGV